MNEPPDINKSPIIMVRNFLFHRVNPKRNKLWDPMDLALFEKCINYITKKYEVVLLEELMFSDKLYSSDKIATIMFDDGYKDNIEFAAPILAKFNCKASFYVVTDCIDNNILTWTHILDHTFQHTNIDEVILDFDFLPVEFKTKELVGEVERLSYVKKLKPFLKSLSHQQREEVLERISNTYSDVELPRLMMNWDDLVELKNAGHYIGSHTVNHYMLGTMNDEGQIMNEILQSGNRIKENLGYFPLTISYPVGSYNSITKQLAKEAGYSMGLAVKQNIYNPKKDDVYEIPRIELYNEPWWKTRFRITDTLGRVKSLIKYK